MGRPKKTTFADQLDNFLDSASEQEVRDAANSIANYARWRKFGFRLRIETLNPSPSQRFLEAVDKITPEEK